jgi:hypothetical protein
MTPVMPTPSTQTISLVLHIVITDCRKLQEWNWYNTCTKFRENRTGGLKD